VHSKTDKPSQPPPSARQAESHTKMDLQTLLVALMSENNDIRSQAEKSLNDEWLKNAPDSLLLQLGAQSRVAESETVSCAV